MSLTSTEQALLQAGIDAIPPVFASDDRVKEDLSAMAKMVGVAVAVGTGMLERIKVGTATVDTAGVDWLDLVAEDYGTNRANDETDAVCRKRMRQTPKGVVRTELIELAQEIVTASGVNGTVAMVEMPRDAAYFGSWTNDEGVGGTFAVVASGVMKFTPTTGFKDGYPPCWIGRSGEITSSAITLAGSANPENDGQFTITGLDDDGVTISNTGVAVTDTEVFWSVIRFNYQGVPLDGAGKAYFSRGYRMWRGQPITGLGERSAINGIIMILPVGCTDSTRRSVLEMLRQRAAAGVIKLVEYAR
jgi:hypothetical protein